MMIHRSMNVPLIGLPAIRTSIEGIGLNLLIFLTAPA